MSCDHNNHDMKIKSPKAWYFKKCPPANILLHAFQILVILWPLWQKFCINSAKMQWDIGLMTTLRARCRRCRCKNPSEELPVMNAFISRHVLNQTWQPCNGLQGWPVISAKKRRGTNGDQWSLEFRTSEDMNLGNWRLPWAIIPTSKGVESHLFQAKHLLLRASMKALRSKMPKSCSQHRNSTGLSNLAFWQNLTERQRSIRTRQNEIEWGAVQK